MPRQQKISMFSALRPTGVDPTAGARSQAISGLFEQAGDIAFQEGAKRREKEGRIAGALSVKRDEEGKVIAPEEKDDFSIFGQSFNKSAIVAHRAQIGIDNKAELDRLEEQHSLDPEGFKNAVAASRAGMLKGMPDEIAGIVSLDFDKSVSSRLSQINKNFFNDKQAKDRAVSLERVESITDEISNAARAGNQERVDELLLLGQGELAGMVEAGTINPSKAGQLIEGIRESITKQSSLSQIDDIVFDEGFTHEQKIEKGYTLLKSMRGKELADLNADQKDAVLREVEGKIRSVEREYSALLREQKKQVDYSDIQKKLTDTHPEIVVDKKKGDDYWQDVVEPRIVGASHKVKSAAQAEFIATLKFVPKGIKEDISNSLLSGDPQLVKDAADTLGRLEKIPGMADQVVKPWQRAFAELVVNLSKNLDGTEAVERAFAITDPRNKQQIETRTQEIKDNDWSDDYREWVTDEFDTMDNVNTSKVTEEFKHLFEAYYKSNGDEDAARDYATRTIDRNWKQSDFGFMKHPPELYYDSPPSVMREQLARDIRDRRFFEGFEKIDFNKENLFLMSDKRTSTEAARGAPTYRITILDNNGEFHVLDRRYQPDDSEFKGKQLDISLEKARAMFEGRVAPKTEEEVLFKFKGFN